MKLLLTFAVTNNFAMDDIISIMIECARKDLRNHCRESVYATAKRAGMRAETVKRIEAGKGSVQELAKYMDAWCHYRPQQAYKILYNVSSVVAQYNTLWK